MEYNQGDFVLYKVYEKLYVGQITSVYSTTDGDLISVNPEFSLNENEWNIDPINIFQDMVIQKIEGIRTIEQQVRDSIPHYFI